MANPIKIPNEVQQAMRILRENAYDAYIVGGSTRDAIMGRTAKDWDVTTNALPEDIQRIFPHSLYLNTFGTVTVRIKDMPIEITTYRAEGKYSDSRHPDTVEFGVSLEEDLQRRDFTINAIAYDGENFVDPYNGTADISAGVIQAVGNPSERFQEDALRMLRAIRFSSQLGFKIESATWQALIDNAQLIKNISGERIRDELVKMLQTNDPLKAFLALHDSGLLKIILPELSAGVGVEQNLHHIYTVFTHNMYALQFCPSDDWQVRLAALLHDIGKPQVKEGDGKYSTFHNHEIAGAKMARKALRRLKFSKEEIQRITHLIRHHMFYSDTDDLTDAGVRRLLQRVGPENIEDLIAVRVADRMGSGVYKEKPYRLLELERRLEHVQKDPISTSMLEIDGNILMKEYGLKPGAKIGVVLHKLLDEVLDDPKHNTQEYLSKRSKELVDSMKDMSEADARAIMKEYRNQLSNINAYKG